ncbi:MAG: ABC transporter permease [Gemmatimonadaceae bacterium]
MKMSLNGKMRALLQRMRGVFASDSADADTREEFESHLSMQVAEYEQRGMSHEEARRHALIDSGGLAMATEAVRERRGLPWIETLLADVRYGARALKHSPAYTIVAAITLALGIGANTAIFSVVNGVVLRPLPYAESDRLMSIKSGRNGRNNEVSVPDFMDWREQARSFSAFAAGFSGATVLTGSGEPERLSQSRITSNTMDVLRMSAVFGRGFAAGEDDPAAPRVAMLSEGAWHRRFGSDSTVVGRTLIFDGHPTTIIGIAPDAMRWPQQSDVWFTTRFTDRDKAQGSRGARWIGVIGRLANGVRYESAVVEMNTIATRLSQLYPQRNTGITTNVTPMLASLVGGMRGPLMLLLGAVGFVLLIACANVASLTLGRVATRDAELAVRTALGAGRARIVRQIMTESVLLAVVGGTLGILVGYIGIKALVSIAPAGLPRIDSIALDARVLAFTLALTMFTGALFGIIPALQGATVNLHDRLRAAGRGARGQKGSTRTRRTLVVAELALAIVLLAGAGLLLRSFALLRDVDPGFRSENVATFSVALPSGSKYETSQQQSVFSASLLNGISRVPGVTAAAITFGLPLSGQNMGFTFEVRGRPAAPLDNEPRAQARVASLEYFSAMGIPLLRGRQFDSHDRLDAPQVLLISNEVARRFFPNEDPVGKYIQTGWGMDGRKYGGEVIGVVGDVRQLALDQDKTPHIYMTYEQWPLDEYDVVVRTTNPIASVFTGAKAVLKELDSEVPMNGPQALSTIVERSMGERRYFLTLLASFAVIATALSVVGVYGVIAYGVQQRRREIGIRLALGATRRSVVNMVLSEGLRLVALSVVLGTAGAFALTRLLQSMLFQVDAHDPVIFTLAPILLTIAAALACVIPARAAARNNPAEVIRAD